MVGMAISPCGHSDAQYWGPEASLVPVPVLQHVHLTLCSEISVVVAVSQEQQHSDVGCRDPEASFAPVPVYFT